MTERKNYDNKIELCQPCEGKGYIQRDELTDYHRRDYDRIRSTCGYCEGVGRVVAEKTTVYRPLTELEKTTEGRF